jgi:hypothetical protein
MTGGYRRTLSIAFAALLVALALPALALAHIERPSDWPDPAPDKSVSPAAGGTFPKARPLSSSLKDKLPGDTRVVCHKDSLDLMKASVAKALKDGYNYRPHEHLKLSAHRAKKLLLINARLFKRCKYKEIQPAVFDSGNNDRVVVMPGIYSEPTSRSKKTFDPACDKYETKTEFGDPGALSYDYHINCPNDQNLIAVMGRAANTAPAPDPPNFDRHGIPNAGACIRCNFQLEGSGVSADDVVIDAGRVASGNKGPIGAKKDVGVRADRADGFVLRMLTVRHAKEHGIYVMESDGYLLDRFKAFYNGLYGTLTFVEDHGIQQHCETAGNADSGIYPGAPAETGEQRAPGTAFRYNQIIRLCDSYHNLAGYSATDGNAVHIFKNNFYGNTLGLNTDIATAAGHPGFPGDSMLYEGNNIYSNNFNPYEKGSDIDPAFPYPVGTGLWIAGGNNHQVRNNNIYDNWRRGTMLFTIPDVLVCGPGMSNDHQKGCDPKATNTSHRNRQFSNKMGLGPDGKPMPNGVDFWWDDFPTATADCWYANEGPKPITTSPATGLPNCANGKSPDTSHGKGNMQNESELAECLASFESRNFDQSTTTCPWLFTPPKPGSPAALAANSPDGQARQLEGFLRYCTENPGSETCKAYLGPLGRR